jgi:hypothetical protein
MAPPGSDKARRRLRRFPPALIALLALLAIAAAAVAYAAGGGDGSGGGVSSRHMGQVNCAKEDGVCARLRRGAHAGGPGNSLISAALKRRLHQAVADGGAVAVGQQPGQGTAAPGEAAPKQGESTQPTPGEGAPKQGESTQPKQGETTPKQGEGTPKQGESPAPPIVNTGCPLNGAASSSLPSMYVLGCNLEASDLAHESSPLPFWGRIDCAEQSRYAYVEEGGDNHLSVTGEPLNGAYRQLTVFDGDNVFGERCELGENSTSGPTAFYREGDHLLTYYSERLPSNFPLSTDSWQTVMQMKQAQPSHDNGGGVALEMEARQNHWEVVANWNTIWQFPAQTGVWTRFVWDVYYSKDPSKGWVQVSADLNGDGDFNDPGERSPVIHTATLATEIPGYQSEDGIAAGEAIPSHLRIGIYHDPSIPCPAPTGCSIDVDNVAILQPPA